MVASINMSNVNKLFRNLEDLMFGIPYKTYKKLANIVDTRVPSHDGLSIRLSSGLYILHDNGLYEIPFLEYFRDEVCWSEDDIENLLTRLILELV